MTIRNNWSKNNTNDLEKVIKEWEGKGPATKDTQGKPLSLFKFAHSKRILPYTFQKYAFKDKEKRLKVVVQDRRKSIVSTNNTDFLSDMVVRADRANDRITHQESISTLQELEPKLTHIQSKRYFVQTFFKNNAGKVKKRLVKAQQTTTKHS